MLKQEYKATPKNVTYKQALDKLTEFFDYDKDKALAFYMRKNDDLEGLSPYEMIKIGKGRKLIKWIERCQAA